MVKRKGLPQVGELVMCTVNKLTENAAWCRLDEYPESEGMVHVSESAGRWIYNIKDAVKVGKQYVAKVINVYPESGQASLSLKRVSKYDEKRKLVQYMKEQHSENILSQIAKSLGKSLDEAYGEVGFILQEEFGELSEAFGDIKDDYTVLDKLNLKPEWKDAVTKTIGRMFASKKVLLKAELEIKCYGENGVNAIKDSLLGLEGKGFTVKYISAPKYIVEAVTNDPKKREKEMVAEMEDLVKGIKSSNGESSYRMLK